MVLSFCLLLIIHERATRFITSDSVAVHLGVLLSVGFDFLAFKIIFLVLEHTGVYVPRGIIVEKGASVVGSDLSRSYGSPILVSDLVFSFFVAFELPLNA